LVELPVEGVDRQRGFGFYGKEQTGQTEVDALLADDGGKALAAPRRHGSPSGAMR
jgi:hypothetical protein